MTIRCAWEHNGNDTILWAIDFPGAFSRGENLETAVEKMFKEVQLFIHWAGIAPFSIEKIEIVQEVESELQIKDADSDILFINEKQPLMIDEYQYLKTLALKSAADFYDLYNSIPNKNYSQSVLRKTFYGQAPRTAEEMYIHTSGVNGYYFGEIGLDISDSGNICEIRKLGFELLEKESDFLLNKVFNGSYGEKWTLRKVVRRFIWHDRIHAKAMYKMALKKWDPSKVNNPFCFQY